VEAANLVPIWFYIIIFSTYGFPYTQFLIVHKKNAFMMFSLIITGLIFILVTAILVYWFGIMGATIGIVLSNLAIQLPRKWYARSLGCNKIGEKEFIIAMTILTSLYLINNLIRISFLYKSAGFIILAIWAFYYFNLLVEIKEIIVRLRQRAI
jgi:O-antigen/teichoic acid export membrane protein